MKPKEYDMTDADDIERWFREMEGYLNTGYGENKSFVNGGTDYEGRYYAFEAFKQFKQNTLASLPFLRACQKKYTSKEDNKK